MCANKRHETNKEKQVMWMDSASGNITESIFHKCPISTAIALQREQGKKHDYTYASDEEALDDFMAVHWAWLVEPEE